MVMGNLEDGIGDGMFDECWLLEGLSVTRGCCEEWKDRSVRRVSVKGDGVLSLLRRARFVLIGNAGSMFPVQAGRLNVLWGREEEGRGGT